MMKWAVVIVSALLAFPVTQCCTTDKDKLFVVQCSGGIETVYYATERLSVAEEKEHCTFEELYGN